MRSLLLLTIPLFASACTIVQEPAQSPAAAEPAPAAAPAQAAEPAPAADPAPAQAAPLSKPPPLRPASTQPAQPAQPAPEQPAPAAAPAGGFDMNCVQACAQQAQASGLPPQEALATCQQKCPASQ